MKKVSLNKNYENFPHHFFAPNEVDYDDHKYRNFLVRFDNLFEIYNYLKSNPEINTKVFHELSSETGTYSFAGIHYEDALEDLTNFNEEGYVEFLNLVRELAHLKSGYQHEYEVTKTLAGGHLSIPAYSSGAPLCYESYERVKRPKFLNIHASLSYPWYTNKRQVLHRAVILMSIINALEKNGYNINLNTFELSEKRKELIYIVVNIKHHGERTNLQTLYKTNCHVEFLRRILFRVLETMSVTEDWSDGYGHTCDEDMVKDILKIGRDDIYFGTPTELKIKGDDLGEDFKACLAALELQNRFDVREITQEFQEKVRKIIK